MRKMAKGTEARWLARAVCLLLVAPLLAVGPVSQRAAAQEATTAFKIVQVAVLDFVNKTPYQTGILGRKAGDALVVALDAVERFEPLQRDQVEHALQELGLRTPLGYTAQQRLGKHLDVAGVISGEVREVALVPKPEGQTARVTLAVEMVDVATGEPVNGALVSSSSSPKPGYAADRDVLINEALREAAYEAVQQMLSYQAPQIYVASADPYHASLKGGSHDGLRVGMEMVVLRFGDKVGRIRLTDVEASVATAEILENLRGITTGDKAVGVFRLPAQPLPPQVRVEREEKARRIKQGKAGALSLLVALVGFLAMTGKTSPADEPTRGVEASSLANTASYEELAPLYSFDSLILASGGLLLTWEAPTRDKVHIVGFKIYRNGQFQWLQPPGEGYYFIDPMSIPLGYLAFTVSFDVSIDADSGLVTALDWTIGEAGAAPRATAPMPPPTIARQPTNYGTDWTLEDWPRFPPTAGETYEYSVTTLVSQQVISAGGGGGGGGGGEGEGEGEGEAMPPANASRAGQATRSWVMMENQKPGVAGPATCLYPPPLVSPVDGTQVSSLSSVDFTFLSTPAADDYVLQVSRSAQFTPADTVEYPVVSAWTAPFTERHRLVTDLETRLPPPSGGGSLHWRIGARNSGDQVRPRLTPGLERTKSQDMGYVWSRPGTFMAGGASLAPPQAPQGTARPRKPGVDEGDGPRAKSRSK